MGSEASQKGFVTMTKRPRPDHPTEKQPLCVREDMIALVVVDEFNYTPDDKAAVRLLPNAKVLRGEATFVYTVTGGAFCVMETPDEVIRLIGDARKGVTKETGYTPAAPSALAAPES